MRTGQVKLVSPIPVPIPLPIETATLVRITQGAPHILDRSYGNYSIMPRKASERYRAMTIGAARVIAGTKENKREWVVTAFEIAEDLARECNTNIWGIGSTVTGEIIAGSDDDEHVESVRGFNGIFVSEFEVPSDDELEMAYGLLSASDETLITRGNEAYDQFHDHKHIHDGFKRAAARQGVKPEWVFRLLDTPNCPHCGAKLLIPTATVCATCHRDVAPIAAVATPAAVVTKQKRTAKTEHATA